MRDEKKKKRTRGFSIWFNFSKFTYLSMKMLFPLFTQVILPSSSYPLVVIPSEQQRERLVHYQMENTGM